MDKPIYLDYNATTPCEPIVVEAMLPYFSKHHGNAASRNHAFGWSANEAIRNAKAIIAEFVEVKDAEITFTSGATESINLAIKGIAELYYRKGKHIITTVAEHKAVLDTCEYLEKKGYEVTYLSVDKHGLINLDELQNAIRKDTILVSVLWANNETGVIQPMKEIGDICTEKEVIFFSDATQAIGKIQVYPKRLGVHLMAFSAHKFYGPKGIGMLYASSRSPRIKLAAQIHGGGHQNGLRSGTANVPGIVGAGAAIQYCLRHSADKNADDPKSTGLSNSSPQYLKDSQQMATLIEQFEHELSSLFPDMVVHGKKAMRLPNVSNIRFPFVEAEALLATCKHQIAASTGSACSSNTLEPSHVLLSMGLSEREAHCALRISIGRTTTHADLRKTVQILAKGVGEIRERNPLWEMSQKGLL